MKEISLPKLPASWDELSSEQMVELNRLRFQTGQSEHAFMFHAFCYLCRISISDIIVKDEDGTLIHLFRRINDRNKPYGEYFPLHGWQLHFYIDTMLKWLTEDCDRLADVFPSITLQGKRFSSPGYAMAGMTYQQHQYTQRYMAEYQRINMRLLGLYKEMEQNGNYDSITGKADKLMKKREEVRRYMMATVFTPESKVSSRLVDGKQVVYNPPLTDYIFSTDQIEREAPLFAHFSVYHSDAVMQHFCGVMKHYKKIYPLLFKESDGGGSTDFIRVEESTLNALQSKLQFSNYQTIYDSNAPFILGKLNAIMQEAKSIEEASRKMPSRKGKR